MTTAAPRVKLALANPTGLGLFGLAIVTLVAASQKLELTSGLSYVIVYAVFLGATAQLVASLVDFLHENVWGATVFGAYALFWYAMAGAWLVKLGAFGPELAAAADVRQLGFAFLGYLLFSVMMTVGATQISKVIFAVMVCIDVLLAALTLNAFGVLPEATQLTAALAELTTALLSLYAACAVVLNTTFGRPLFPLGQPFGFGVARSAQAPERQPAVPGPA